MTNKKRKPSILWLSDIHYKQFLKSNKIRVGTTNIEEILEDKNLKLPEIKCINKYFENLIKQIRAENYTHILITGDLAFSGDTKQYVSLYYHFMEEILEDENVRLITIPGNHDVDYSSLNDFTKEYIKNKTFEKKVEFIRDLYDSSSETKDKYKLLSNYEDFFNIHIKNRLLRFKEKGKIELFSYEQSNGLFGIIHDLEYNIIFNCLNSSWVCVGNNNLIESIKTNKDSLNINNRKELNDFLNNAEHGNIIIGELTDIQSAFNDLKSSSQQECCVITCMHHPRSWLHQGHLYNDKNFQWLLDVTDIFLSGHLHVPHHPPTTYRDKSFFFEAPQLLDYHLYKNAEYDKDKILNLGYSIITIDHQKSNFTKKNISYNLNKSGKILLRSEENSFNTYQFKKEIAQRKSILFDFTFKGDIEQFFEDKAIDHKKILLPDSGSDFYEKHCKLLRSIPEFSERDSEKIISDSDGKYVAIYGENKCFVIIFKNPNKKEELINDFSNRINAVIDELKFDNSKPFNLKILFYDYWVFLFNARKVKVKVNDNEKDDYENKLSEEANLMHNYQLNYKYLKDFFTILRYNIFKEDETSEKNISLDKLSLSFEIVNLERYLSIFC